jgi:HAD superfamily hydrolase (TIGR01509 family)
VRSTFSGSGHRRRLDLDTAASLWQLALDSAYRALQPADHLLALPAGDVARLRHALGEERQRTALLLAGLAATAGVRPGPWLARIPLDSRMLGLAPSVQACVFDLDGVLADSAVLHASAWAVAFDEFLLRFSERAGWHFRPFDREADYRTYVEGRPRLAGVHAFLDSRGIHLPEGVPADDPRADTAYGLAQRKTEVLARELRRHGVQPLPHARRYLEAVGHIGLRRGVIAASANTWPMLELARLDTLLDERVDATVMQLEQLRARPAPDVPLAACDRLGVRPEEAVSFTNAPAGVAAARAAGLAVVGVAPATEAAVLRGLGAQDVVDSLGALLDRQLLDGA